MQKRLSILVVLLFVLGFGGVALAQSDTLIIGSGAEAIGLDPRLETDVPSFERINVIMEPLVKFDVEMNLVPALATEWGFGDDNLSLTFRLREGVTWQDGTPFTAADVQYTFDWVLDPDNGAPNRGLYADVSEIEIIDDHQVTFHLANRYSFLLNNIARMPITPKHEGDRADFRQNPLGTGPYVLKSWTRDDRMILVANESYWGGKPNTPNLVFRTIPENSTRLLAFEAGEIDIFQGGIVPQELSRLEKDDRFLVQRTPGTGYNYLGFNTKVGALSDQKVRQALNYLINKEGIVERVLAGIGTPGLGPVPQSLPWYNPDVQQYEYNPEQAEALLTEAGYAPGDIQIRLFTNENAERMRIAEIVQFEAQRIGVEIEVIIEEWGAYLSRIQETDDFDIFILGWAGQLDPDRAMIRQFHTDGANNYGKYSNKELDALLEYGRTIPPESQESIDVYHKAQEIVVREVPYGFINYSEEVSIQHKYIKDWAIHPYSAGAWQDAYRMVKDK